MLVSHSSNHNQRNCVRIKWKLRIWIDELQWDQHFGQHDHRNHLHHHVFYGYPFPTSFVLLFSLLLTQHLLTTNFMHNFYLNSMRFYFMKSYSKTNNHNNNKRPVIFLLLKSVYSGLTLYKKSCVICVLSIYLLWFLLFLVCKFMNVLKPNKILNYTYIVHMYIY